MDSIINRFRLALGQLHDGKLTLQLRLARWWMRFIQRGNSHRLKIEIGLWLLWVLFAAFMLPMFQSLLAPYIHEYVFEQLQEVIVGVGAAMIGATAIVASFVLFALQVNVERLPYGLFTRFSSDWRLLSLFGGSFGLSVVGTSLSLIMDRAFAALVIIFSITLMALVLRLLLAAYSRSLVLIDPLQQLSLLCRSIDQRMGRFERRLDTVIQLNLRASPPAESENAANRYQPDDLRALMLQQCAGWDQPIKDAISHATAYAQRAGERGDNEVSAAALSAVLQVNKTYVRIKGRTFFANVPFFDNPLVTDGTVNASLEDLRRLYTAALARKDELQTQQVYRAYLNLARIYLKIEYRSQAAHRSHALLAIGYLERAVEAAVPAGLTDTVMTGIGVLGGAARAVLSLEQPDDMVGITDKIGVIGSVGAASENFRPITLSAMEQLSDIMLALFHSEADIHHAAGEVMGSVTLLTRLFLGVPDSWPMSMHATYLSPFYSGASQTSFNARFIELGNALLQVDASNEKARSIADNIATWANEIHQPMKEVLLLAVEKRSPLVLDLVHWIASVCEVMLAVASAPATREHSCDELRKLAGWLFAALSWIPRDADTAKWLETYSFTEKVFEFGVMSVRRDFEDGYHGAWKLLLNWGFEAGRIPTGWGTLGRALMGLVALALRPGENRAAILETQVLAELAKPDAPDEEMRRRTARELRERVSELGTRSFTYRSIERALENADREPARSLLNSLADILSPQLPANQQA